MSSVSLGCGLPTAMQMQDWSIEATLQSSTSEDAAALSIHHRIEQFRYRLSQTLSSGLPGPGNRAHDREKLTMYKLLNSTLVDLEREVLETNGK